MTEPKKNEPGELTKENPFSGIMLNAIKATSQEGLSEMVKLFTSKPNKCCPDCGSTKDHAARCLHGNAGRSCPQCEDICAAMDKSDKVAEFRAKYGSGEALIVDHRTGHSGCAPAMDFVDAVTAIRELLDMVEAKDKLAEDALSLSRRANEVLDRAKAKMLKVDWIAIGRLRNKYGPGGQAIDVEHSTNVLILIDIIEKLTRESE